ncbi:MAG: DUF2796 domain-containing protein [Aquabacterium sp.]|nr:DUF2796 domain-containing protein [Aquabacterium sp.]
MAARLHPAAAVAAAVAIFAVVACFTTTAQAAGAHQHGVASLELVADGNNFTATLDSPLDNLLGFERGPRTDAERAKVRAMAQTLRSNATLVVPAAAASCQLQGVDLASDVIAPALLAAAPAPAAAPAAATAAKAGDHADLEVVFRFQCAQPQALKSVALGGLFQAFPRLRQLDTALAAPGVQRGAKLRPQQSSLRW